MNLGIGYESSDDEEEKTVAQGQLPNASTTVAPEPSPAAKPAPESNAGPPAAAEGPALGPTVSPPPAEEGGEDDPPPGSPYTTERTIVQNLTLPTVPNFNIPPSPPGSPPQNSTKKFAQFLELKKKGQHFNQRLESSSVLRDPGHLTKLMDFAKIKEEDQYVSTLPEDLAVPTTFPDWAYFDELNASQKSLIKVKEEARRGMPRDFVSASRSSGSSNAGTPSKDSRQNTAERVMAGLDRQQSSQSSSHKRKELEHRGKDDHSSRSRWRSRSRSPKRRRSRSSERR